MKTKSPLSYFGSDSQVAGKLAAMLDHCKHVTIIFCGGMSILPHLKATHIVANDLHEHVINFYRVSSGWHGLDLIHELEFKCKHTLSHPAELHSAYHRLGSQSPVDRAWAFWAQCWVGRKGKCGTKNNGGMPSIRRTAGGGSNASRLKSVADDLQDWRDEFRRCEFESVCFRELLPKVADKKRVGVYCDPPFVGAGDSYLHSFDEQDHRDLAKLLGRFQEATVVLRYGDDPLIRELYKDWNVIESVSKTQSGSTIGELWITNRQPLLTPEPTPT